MIKRDNTEIAVTKYSCIGPLARHIDKFLAHLDREGYAPKTKQAKCAVVANLSRWLKRRRLPLAKLNERRLKQFRVTGRSVLHRGDAFTAQQLLEFLRGLGCIPALRKKIDDSAAAELTRDFERFLSSERGLSPSTLVNYLPVARSFLAEHFGRKPLRFTDLRLQDLHRFILHEARRVSRKRAQLTVTALRSFLRFLRQRGAINTDLATALPTVASWRLSHLPKSLSPEQVERVLECCDRSTRTGQRDYAILLLLARLGLRAGEVLTLTLEDLDWECGEIIVHGKGQRLERLPMPKDVGTALVRYLRYVRPSCSTRRVFIRMVAPFRGLARAVAIDCVVRRALKRAGLNPDFKGAHLLRHSLATNLLRRGASLSEIGQLLRHKQPTTTQIYARVNIEALRGISLPWMGGVS